MKLKTIIILSLLLCFSSECFGAITYVGTTAIGASTGTDVTRTIPNHSVGDLVLIGCVVRDVDDTITPTTLNETWTSLGTADRGTTARYFFWYTIKTTTNNQVTFDKNTTSGDTYAIVWVFSGVDTSSPIPTYGSIGTTTSDPSTFTSITTANANSTVVLLCLGEDNNNSSVITTGTDPSAYTEQYVESSTGNDGVATISYATRTTAGATGTVSCNWNTAIPVGAGGILLEIKERASTGQVLICD